MKKLFAMIIAVAMVFACVVTVSAAETTLPDTESSEWWTGHTAGVEVTEEGVTITYKSTSLGGTNNWNGTYYVLYANTEAVVGGAGYVEKWVQRPDNYGWGFATNSNELAALKTAGVSYSCLKSDWTGFADALVAGTEGTITAVREGNTVTATMSIAGAYNTITIPVAAEETIYISLFGDGSKTTDIKVNTGVSTKIPTATTVYSTNFWGEGRSHGIAVDTDGVEVTFKNTTDADAVNSWDGLSWILYHGSKLPVSTDNVELWSQRGDNWGWNSATNSGDAAGLETAGITYEGVIGENWGSWDNFLTAMKAGAEGKITAVREGNNIKVTTVIGDVTATVTVPAPADETVYLALTSENARLSNISVKSLAAEPEPTPDPENPKMGDTALALPIALMAVSAAVIVTLKKKVR